MTTTRTTATATRTAATRSTRRHLTLAGVALVAGLLVVGCSSTGATKAGDAAATPATSSSSSSSSSTPTADLPGGPDAAPTDQPTGTTDPAPAPAPTPDPTPAPTSPMPVIASFTTPEDIDCHNGDLQMFSASWTTEHATTTTISIDGPGAYRSYGPNDADSLPFNCSSAHTFLLTATGPGGTASKTITLQPRNVQTAPTDDQGTPGDDVSEGMGEGEGF